MKTLRSSLKNISFVILAFTILNIECAAQDPVLDPSPQSQPSRGLYTLTEQTVTRIQKQAQKTRSSINAKQKHTDRFMNEIRKTISDSSAIAGEIKAKYSNCNAIECFKELQAELQVIRDRLALTFNEIKGQYTTEMERNKILADEIKTTWDKITLKSKELKSK